MLRLFLFLISLVIGIFILRSPTVHEAITHIGNFGIIGAFFAGIFFVMSFTVIPSAAVLLTLSESMHPLVLSFFAGAGGVCGDYLLMRYLRTETDELLQQVHERNHFSIERVLKSRLLHWLGPVIGALVIASPFPDELGITLLGITKLETKKFILLTFVLDVLAVFLIITVGGIFF